MKWLLLIAIKLYWFFTPPDKRRQCLFKKSCSHFVFDAAASDGLIPGLKALYYRFKTCRHGFLLYTNPYSGKMEMVLANNDFITHEEINERLLNTCHDTKP